MQKENFLAKNLRFLRVSNKLRQHEIQEKLGTKRNTWSNWENKKSEPSLEILFTIAHFFNTDVGSLLSKDMEKYKTPNTNLTIDQLYDKEEPYQTKHCAKCQYKEELIEAQKATIKALQGQVDALQLVIHPGTAQQQKGETDT